jgi:hypothetical protein
MHTNLHDETRELEWIIVHDQSPSVADHFCDTARDHARGECPRAPSYAFGQMCNETDGKERNECGIGAERWTIVEDGGLYRAGIECASVEGRHLEKIPTVVRKGSGKIGRTENVLCQVQQPSQDRGRWMRN